MTSASVDPFAPARLGPISIRNRIIKAATFEGAAQGNVVTDRLVDFHRTVAAGGAGMTTLAYCAVSQDGQGAPNEIIVQPSARPGLERLTEAVHALGAAASIQLGHAGPVAAGTGRQCLAPSRVFAPQALRFTRAVTTDDIARITGDFARAATLAVDAGFDAVELHFGHGYLVSAFMSPKLNARDDEYGGTAERRARFAREVAAAVRSAVDDRVAVIAKLNMADGIPGGLWLDDSVRIAQILERDGALHAIELTGGSSFQNPMFLFRGDAPIAEMAAAFPPYLRAGFRLTASRFMPSYPFEEAFFLPFARQFREAVSMPLILLGGINRFETVERALGEGFDFVALARALLREPDLPARWEKGDQRESLCIHCNKCMPTIYSGTRCVLVEPDAPPAERTSGPVESGRRPSIPIGSKFGRAITRASASSAFAKIAPRCIVALDLLVHRATRGKHTVSEALVPSVVLTTTGAKSGAPRTVPLACWRDGHDLYVVASNFGGERHPAWSANLLAHPVALVAYDGRTVEVRAELLDPDAKAAIWPQLLAVWPNYDVYAQRSGRDLRVFRLTANGRPVR